MKKNQWTGHWWVLKQPKETDMDENELNSVGSITGPIVMIHLDHSLNVV